MPISSRLGFALVLTLTMAGQVAGQSTKTVAVGDRVRVEVGTLPGTPTGALTYQGILVAVRSDSLWVRTGRAPQPFGIAADDIRRLRVPGRRSAAAGAGRGAAIGALVVGVVGAVLLEGGDEEVSSGAGFVAGAIPGALIGALWGAAVPVQTWLPAELPRGETQATGSTTGSP
jgi:hypothetical protein